MAEQSSGSRATYDGDTYHRKQYRPREVSHIHDVATGSLEGGIGVLATEPLLAAVTGEKVLNPFRGGVKSSFKRIGAGAAIGGGATGLIGALVSHADAKRKSELKAAEDKRKRKMTMMEIEILEPLIEFDIIDNPSARRGVRVDHYEKQIRGREIDRGINDHLRAGVVGALAGVAIPHEKASALKRAGVGAAGGIGLLTALRAMANKDVYGDTTPEAKQTQKFVPAAAAVAAVGYGTHKRLKGAKNRIAALRSSIRPAARGAAREAAVGAAASTVGLSRSESGLVELASRMTDEEGVKKKQPRSALPLAAAGVAGVGAYALLRRKSPLGVGASPQMKALRAAADKGGFARVNVVDTVGGKRPSKLQGMIEGLLKPADHSETLAVGQSISTKKFKGAIFDPHSTGRLVGSPGATLGEENRVTRQINKGKLEEYHVATAAGLEMPHTAPLVDARTMENDYIAKRATGSQSKSIVTRDMIDAHDPNHSMLKDYKKFRSNVSSKIKDFDERAIAENTHPGYKHAMTDEVINHPERFVKQKKIDIAEEYRVHTLGGKALGVTSGRFGLTGSLQNKEAEAAAEMKLHGVHPKLKGNLLAMDMAKDKDGAWHVIETNAGVQSGFLDPQGANKLDVRGPHALYKAITGRHARSTALVGGAGAATAAGVGTSLLAGRRDDKRRVA